MWQATTRFDNLYLAWLKARRGKLQRTEVSQFCFNLEPNLLQLQDELQTLRWQPGTYRQFTLYERKPRLISAAPFRDRVVHHAIMNQVEPAIDPLMHPHSYACRKNKGVHAAVNQYQCWARRYAYVLKLDISQYFSSIDHTCLLNQLHSYLSEAAVLTLFQRIIHGYHTAPGKGLPIGNLTSQFFANVYLDDLDARISHELGIPAYLRYVDDLVLLADSKPILWQAAEFIRQHLQQELKLQLHPHKINLTRTSSKVDMFGYQVSRTRRWLRNENGYRFRRRLKAMAQTYAAGEVDHADIQPRIASWIGHALHGETEGLRRRIFDEVLFQRKNDPEKRTPHETDSATYWRIWRALHGDET